jgi:hypothetical protein
VYVVNVHYSTKAQHMLSKPSNGHSIVLNKGFLKLKYKIQHMENQVEGHILEVI